MRKVLSVLRSLVSNSFFYLGLMIFLSSSLTNAQETIIDYNDALNSQGFVLQSEGVDGVNITFSIESFTFTEKNIKGNNLTTI